MHAATERRADDATRVPLDLWVRLRHEDFAEPFDADGVDLSRGGLALRSDFLPEVGDRMRCRFDSPSDDGDELELGGEVVWAHDAGDRSGQFGLRFTDVDQELEASLARILHRLAPEGPAAVRLHLDGVASPVEADIVEHDEEWLTAEQALPFLKLGMGVVVEGSHGPPRGRLAAVSLRVEDGTPRLVLQVDLEQLDAPPADAPAPREDTLDEEEPEAVAEAIEPDATLQDYHPPVEVLADPGREAQEVRVFAVADEADEDDELVAAEAFDARDDEDRAAITPGDLQAPVEEGSGPAFLAKVRPTLERAKTWIQVRAADAKEKAGPTARAALARVAALWAVVVAKAGPLGQAVWARLRSTWSALGTLIARKVFKKARRRTSPPPKRVAESPRLRRQRTAQEPEAAPKAKPGRRILVLSILAFLGVGAAVYALSGDDEAETPAPTPAAAPAPAAAAPAPAAPAPVAAAPAPVEAAPAPDPEQGGTVVPEGGRLDEPTFPSLSEANARREAAVTEGSSFGASEVEGRASTIRMSQPVTVLRGQAQEGGFTVTIPGSLALDRAGPIAAAHPAIERATILNRGDHAVLTVRFVAGRDPAYRVVARGSAIELTVAR